MSERQMQLVLRRWERDGQTGLEVCAFTPSHEVLVEKVSARNELTTEGIKALWLRVAGVNLDAAPHEARELKRYLKNTGEALFQRVFNGKIGEAFRRELNAVPKTKLRIRVLIHPDHADLSHQPYELMCCPIGGHADLAKFNGLTLVRSVPGVGGDQKDPIQGTIRVLFVGASPKGWDPIPLRDEYKMIQDILAGKPFACQAVFHCTEQAMATTIQQVQPHILIYYGHGEYDEVKKQGSIILERDNQTPDPVNAGDFRAIIGHVPDLRLVLLICCKGNPGDGVDLDSSVALSVVQAGVPAVVAMQWEVMFGAANAFCEAFFQALAARIPVDEAVTLARIRVQRKFTDTGQWALPALYLSTCNGNILGGKVDVTTMLAQIAKQLQEGNWPTAQVNADVLYHQDATQDNGPAVALVNLALACGQFAEAWKATKAAMGESGEKWSQALTQLFSRANNVEEVVRATPPVGLNSGAVPSLVTAAAVVTALEARNYTEVARLRPPDGASSEFALDFLQQVAEDERTAESWIANLEKNWGNSDWDGFVNCVAEHHPTQFQRTRNYSDVAKYHSLGSQLKLVVDAYTRDHFGEALQHLQSMKARGVLPPRGEDALAVLAIGEQSVQLAEKPDDLLAALANMQLVVQPFASDPPPPYPYVVAFLAKGEGEVAYAVGVECYNQGKFREARQHFQLHVAKVRPPRPEAQAKITACDAWLQFIDKLHQLAWPELPQLLAAVRPLEKGVRVQTWVSFLKRTLPPLLQVASHQLIPEAAIPTPDGATCPYLTWSDDDITPVSSLQQCLGVLDTVLARGDTVLPDRRAA